MKVSEIKAIYKSWENNGMVGFFLDYFTNQTGHEVDTPEYSAAYEWVWSQND